MTLELYKSTASKTKGQIGWRLKRNGRIISIGGELYKRRAGALKTLRGVFGDPCDDGGYSWITRGGSGPVCHRAKFVDLTGGPRK